MMLNGIDVSSNQPANICSLVPNDFAIVKMSGNPQSYSWNYVNPSAKQQCDEAYKKHRCVGLYHFTWGKEADTEANFFIDQVEKLGYIGKAVLVIDYEGEALSKGASWVKKFAKTIKSRTGVTPVIYASGSVVVGQQLKSLGYPIWVANYSKGYTSINGYSTSGCTIYPGCEDSILWQFTSSGYLNGYGSPLDLNVFYGKKSDWLKLASTSSKNNQTQQQDIESSSSEVKSVEEVAKEVLEGKWGNGDERKSLLSSAGYIYSTVQAKVNEILGTKSKKSIDAIAKEVLDGKWGNGSARKEKLQQAGYDYDKVQKKVNQLISNSSVEKVAKEVIQGKWGNGSDRVSKLKQAGYDPEVIQAKVNELLK